jgi:hypothetical protein
MLRMERRALAPACLQMPKLPPKSVMALFTLVVSMVVAVALPPPALLPPPPQELANAATPAATAMPPRIFRFLSLSLLRMFTLL